MILYKPRIHPFVTNNDLNKNKVDRDLLFCHKVTKPLSFTKFEI